MYTPFYIFAHEDCDNYIEISFFNQRKAGSFKLLIVAMEICIVLWVKWSNLADLISLTTSINPESSGSYITQRPFRLNFCVKYKVSN